MKNKNYEGILVDRDLEIFELEEKVRELSKYQGMYFKKVKDLERVKQVIIKNMEILPDEVKYNFKNLLDELSGIKYN